MNTVHRVRIPLRFPSGIAPGAGKADGNRLVLALDGRGRHVLRGTALAGALRSAWARSKDITTLDPAEPDAQLVARFGKALEGDQGDHSSPLRVADVVLEGAPGGPGLTSETRHHNAIDRHTGAVRDKGLFTVEALPPGTRGVARLELVSDRGDEEQFLAELAGLLDGGLRLGGHGARGVGSVELDVDRPLELHSYDLDQADHLHQWLDDSWAERSGAKPGRGRLTVLKPARVPEILVIDAVLEIPPGQDICIGDGRGLDHAIEPQVVQCADGQQRYRIPGSSLRGALRAWTTRLAARAGEPVAESVARFHDNGPCTGDDVGWAFVTDDDERRRIQQRLAKSPAALAELIKCPVTRLFGSLFAAGRIHVADALSRETLDEAHLQTRMHVAVDSITGGANDGFLFSHQALLAGVTFDLRITIDQPEAQEADWIAAGLRALDMGLIRIGNSKSSGRLAFAGPVEAYGPQSETFANLTLVEA